MSDTRHEVEVQFTAKDLTSPVINKIHKSAGVLSKRVDRITEQVVGFAKTFGGLGAVFGFGASIMSANSYLKTIDDISTLTGMAANKTAGMQHAMEQSNLTSEETRAIMITLAQKQSEIANGSVELAKTAKRYGVNLKQGPQAALTSMAESIKKGKMGTGEVVTLLGEAGAKAMDLLKKGGPEVQRLLAEGAKQNSHINAMSIAQYKEMDVQMKRVKQAWTRITTTVMIKLAPALTKLTKSVEESIAGWIDGASHFGNFLVDNMDSAINLAVTFGKVMSANYIMMKLTGEGIIENVAKFMKLSKGATAATAATAGAESTGAGGILASMLGRGKSSASDISGRKGAMAKRAASDLPFKHVRQQVKSLGASFILMLKPIGKFGGKFGKIFGKIGKFGKVFAQIIAGSSKLAKVARVLMKLTFLGAAVAAVVAGTKQLMSNVDGVRDRIVGLLGKTWDNIKSIGEAVEPIFGPGSFLRGFFNDLGGAFKTTIEFILFLLERMTHAAAVAATMAVEVVGPAEAERILAGRKANKILQQEVNNLNKATGIQSNLTRIKERELKITAKTVEGYNKMIAAYKASGAVWAQNKRGIAAWTKQRGFEKFTKFKESPEGREQRNYDFRGSRFDIQQNFAEGFDPDRIAVAFANDLSSLGERRLQSGLAPAFAAR